MNPEGTRATGGGRTKRPVTYCLIPAELAAKLHEPLRDHFREDAEVEVVVERRGGERRSGADRRAAEEAEPPEAGKGERREDPDDTAGRRLGERRSEVAGAEPPELPRRARRYAAHLRFFRRLEPAGDRAEDLDTARLVARFQAGERDVYSTLYSRYFNRLYAYLRLVVNDHHEAEDLTQDVFVKALAALHRYKLRAQPFRAWLFTIARNTALKHLRKQGRIDLVDPAEAAGRQDEEAADETPLDEVADVAKLDEAPLTALDWIRDPDLVIFMERLPEAQRQVLALRYLLDLSADQIARILDKRPDHVRKLQERGLRFLEDRLRAIGREPKTSTENAPMRRWSKQAPVIRNRRYMLE